MQSFESFPPARWGVRIAMLAALTLLGACQALNLVGSGKGVSAAGVSYLAEIRSANDLPRMRPDAALERAALRQAGHMARADEMAHDTGWRNDFASRMRRNKVRIAAAENIAHGRMDMARLFRMWKTSPGHRKNMLDPRFTHFGLAYVPDADDEGSRYWALVMAP